MVTYQIRRLLRADRDWVVELLQREWGSRKVVSRGIVHDAGSLDGFIAGRAEERIGLVTFRIDGAECEIVTLNSLSDGIGVGTALVEGVRQAAVEAGCRRVWLITTNDNTAALRFYQKKGFSLVAVYRGALEQSRRLKPEIPLVGNDGIPLRDEIEMELRL
jgi:ribosomal protein S18 acetylase RimI-like enzyme